MLRKSLSIAIMAATAVVVTSAHAWQAGDLIVRGGLLM